MNLGYVILDDQLWTIRLLQGVAAKDLQGICTKIIVIIFGEAQAELGYSTQVEELIVSRQQRLRVPIVHHGIGIRQYFGFIRGQGTFGIQVSQLKSTIIAERTLSDVRQQFAMRAEWKS